jgi:plastocyanin
MAARKEQMSRHKHARAWVAAATAILAVAIAVPAFAATVPNHVRQTTVGGERFVPNRLIADTMHFKVGTVHIKSGGTLTFVDKTKNAHTFSIVKKRQVPRTAKAVDNCFGPGPCDEIAIAHGAVNPDTGEEQEPTTPLVNVGKAGFNQPGDSIVLPPAGGPAAARAHASRTNVKITASAGKTLYFICAIHPWMQGKVVVGR